MLQVHLDGTIIETILKDVMSSLVAQFHTLRHTGKSLGREYDNKTRLEFMVPFAFPDFEVSSEECNKRVFDELADNWNHSTAACIFNRYVEYVLTKAWESPQTFHINDLKLFLASSWLIIDPESVTDEHNNTYMILRGGVAIQADIVSLSNWDTPFEAHHTTIQSHIAEFIGNSVNSPIRVDR